MTRSAIPALLAALAACSTAPNDTDSLDTDAVDTDEPADTSEPTDTSDTGDTGTDGVPERFIIHSAVSTPDDRLNYFTLVDTLVKPTTLDYDASVEIPGRARLYAAEGVGFFAIGDSADVSITKYTIGSDNKLVEGDAISLQAYGVSSMGAQAVHFSSTTSAYYKDPAQGQVIAWNPTEMAIEDDLQLGTVAIREGWRTSASDWVGRDGDAFFALSFLGQTYDSVDEGSVLVHIDSETNKVTTTTDDRCRGLSTAANVDGTLYFFSSVINGFGHYNEAGVKGQQDCILRILPGETTFDATWVGSFADTLPEGYAATVSTVTADGELWASVVDLDSAPKEEGATYSDWYASDWTWWHAPITLDTDAVQATTTAGAYSSFTVTEGSHFLVSEAEEDYSESTLVDWSSGKGVDGITLPGFVLDIASVK